MRSRKAAINIGVALINQIVAIICGLIIPRLIINSFGSGINGLTSSITQFLGYIVLLESGVGGVVRASLYKPLAQKDEYSISRILKATEKFFRIISYTFIVYLLIIAIILPYFVKNEFSDMFTLSLILIIGISIFFQYYFGITYQILLQADQRQYIVSILQVITIIMNSILTIILINLGYGIHTVKLASSVIFIIRPIILNIYVNKKYNIIKDCEPDNNAIKQRWDGLGHHIAFLLHNNTDVALLTIFSSVKEVSVYSVYFMIVSSIKTITVTFSSSLEASFGNMIANKEKETIDKNFRIFELISFTITTILFTSASLLILPFISVYTKGITDVNYQRPIFAYILIISQALYCIRVPYNSIVLAAGHYKQTRNGAFMEAIINFVVSIVLVQYLGIVGVVIATLLAIAFRTIQYVLYLTKNIIYIDILEFIKKIIIYSISSCIVILISNTLLDIKAYSYIEWIIYAIVITLISTNITVGIGIIFFKEDFKEILLKIKKIFVRARDIETTNRGGIGNEK